MKTGLKSILFGYHAFWLHPFFVAWAWWKIYGFPLDPRLWVAFFVHDLGYWDCEHMDDVKGERHPEFGARVMHFLFDWPAMVSPDGHYDMMIQTDYWEKFCLYHSRTYAARDGQPISRFGYADKLSFLLYPRWLLKLTYTLSGEWEEYRCHVFGVRFTGHETKKMSFDEWYAQTTASMLKTLKESNYVHRM